MNRRALALAAAAVAVATAALPAAAQTAPTPAIVITPTCGPAGTPIQLRVDGSGWPANVALSLSVTVSGFAGTSWNDSIQNTGPTGSFTTPFPNPQYNKNGPPTPTASGVYIVKYLDNRQTQFSATADYTVPCATASTTSTTVAATTTTLAATTTTIHAATTSSTTTSTTAPVGHLLVDPPLGPPGSVARVTGSGFSPGPVTLSWTPGLGSTAATADATGTFQAYLLVMPKDVLGPRQLVAKVGPTIVATAPFLAVPGTVQPGGFDYRR